MRLFSLVVFVFVCLIGIYSCKSDDPGLSQQQLSIDSTIVAWLDSSNVVATRDASGIYYYADTLNPVGNAVGSSSQVLSFYYTLIDLDSTIISSYSPSDGDSLLCKYNSGAVFPLGLDIGFQFMREGETYSFILPPSLGYEDAPSITTSDGTGIVILQVQLKSILTETDILTQELAAIDDYILLNDLNDTVSVTIERIDTTFIGMTISSIDTTFNYDIDSVEYFQNSGIRYKELVQGQGGEPVNGNQITVNYVGRFLNENTFDSKSNFQVTIGSSIPAQLIPGFDFGLTLLGSDERGLLMLPSSQAYRESAQIVPANIVRELIEQNIIPDYVASVPPYTTILFDLTRVD